MPFRTPPGAPRDLLSLIDTELRQRLEEALDHACLEAMVSARRAAGAPLPVADDARDREEFTASVRALLERLRDEIPMDANEVAEGDEEWRLLAGQIGRAKALPDYWQQFDAVRQLFTADYAQPTSGHGGPTTEDPQTPSGHGGPTTEDPQTPSGHGGPITPDPRTPLGGARRGVLGRLFGRG